MKANFITLIMIVISTIALYYGAQFFVLTTGGNFLFIPIAIIAIGFIAFTNQSFSLFGSLINWGRNKLGRSQELSMEDLDTEALAIVQKLIRNGSTQKEALAKVQLLGEIEAEIRR